ncbi:MAG: hypothetical protein LBC69_02935 [Eubacteriaceae bacterium]|nr:hypothetical protein [Eubacteriaceae bacterium]
MLVDKYENTSMGLSFTLPAGWRFASNAEIANLNQGSSLPDMGEAYGEETFLATGRAIDMHALDEASGSSATIVIAQKPPSETDSVKAFLGTVKEQLSQSEGFAVGELASASVGGAQYTLMPCTYGSYDRPVIRNYYAKLSGAYVICVVTTVNGQDKDTAVSAFGGA